MEGDNMSKHINHCGTGLDPKFVPVFEKKEEQTIPQILEDIVEDMCQNYCKWPDTYEEEMEGCELSESSICANCPLNRLT